MQLPGKGRCSCQRWRSPDDYCLQGEPEAPSLPHAYPPSLTVLRCTGTTRPRPLHQHTKPTPDNQGNQETGRPCTARIGAQRISTTAVHQDDNKSERHCRGSKPSSQPDRCSIIRSGYKAHQQLAWSRSVDHRTVRQSHAEAGYPNKFSTGRRWILSDKQCCSVYGKQEPWSSINENGHFRYTRSESGHSPSQGGSLQAPGHGRISVVEGECEPHTRSNGCSQPRRPGSISTQPPTNQSRMLKTTTGNSHGQCKPCSPKRKQCHWWHVPDKPAWTKQLHCSLGNSPDWKPVRRNGAFDYRCLAIIAVFRFFLGELDLQGSLLCWKAFDACQEVSSALQYADLLACMS